MGPEQLSMIQPYVRVDVGAAFRSFQYETHSVDPTHFLGYLYQHSYITPEAYYALHAQITGITAGARGHQAQGAQHGWQAAAGTAATEQSNRYQVQDLLGEGGMGTVHRAKDLALGRQIAYKQLRRDPGLPENLGARFLDEARINAQLDHPNVVPVHSLEVCQDGGMAMAMKLVVGETVEAYIAGCRERCLAGEPLAEEQQLARRLEHFLKVCDGIGYAHHKGVVHRDLKPANIMIGRWNEVYVMDWGLARTMGGRHAGEDSVELGSGEARLTLTGQVIGTPKYMSPEQAHGRNKELDGRADLYSLGIILQELVCLREAVPGTSVAEAMKNVLSGTRNPVEPLSGAGRVPRELKAIIARATAFERDARYPSVDAFAEDIRRYLRGEAVRAAPDNVFQRLARWGGRHRVATMMVVLTLLLLTSGIVIWSLAKQIAAEQREEQLNRFNTAVAEQAHRIDNHFQSYQGRLRAFGVLAGHALTYGVGAAGPRYVHTDFDSDDTAPPDLRHSVVYGKKVSLDWPVYKLPPALDGRVVPSEVELQIKRLYALRYQLQRMVAESRPDAEPPTDPVLIRQLLLEEGVPVRWSYVGLASGVMFSYPGKGGYPSAYDPRERPWYQLADGRRGLRWGTPYVDLQGQGLILPCVTSLYGEDGTFHGVAGIEITFRYIVDHLLALPDEPAVREAYLLDGDARIVVRSRLRGDAGDAGEIRGTGELQPFSESRVVEAIRSRRSGVVQLDTADGEGLFVFYRLPTLEWTYLVWADPAALRGDKLRHAR
jgi:serine/threonine-protein kinase